MIPQVFHQIWLGPHPLPEEFQHYMKTWLELHPEWVVMVWTDRNRPKLRNEGQYQRTTNWSNRSNLLRYELVLEHGGVYVDIDFECLKNIDPLLKDLDFFAGCEKLPQGWIAPGLFGATPGHPIVKKIVDLIPSKAGAEDDPLYCATGFFTRMVWPHRRERGVRIFEPKYFYPYYCWEMHRKGEHFPNAFAVHHWAKSWVENKL